jgi:hypothetical protein
MLRLFALTAAVVLALWVNQAFSYTSDEYASIEFHPFTIETCTDTGDCDPVNLIFTGKNWAQVRDALRARGWTVAGFGSNQQLHFADEDTLFRQNVQLFHYQSFSRRYHIRLWQVPGKAVTLGAVHHEEGILEHNLLNTWEQSEAFVAGQLCPRARSCGEEPLEEQDAIQGGDGLWRDKANNASATVIRLR